MEACRRASERTKAHSGDDRGAFACDLQSPWEQASFRQNNAIVLADGRDGEKFRAFVRGLSGAALSKVPTAMAA